MKINFSLLVLILLACSCAPATATIHPTEDSTTIVIPTSTNIPTLQPTSTPAPYPSPLDNHPVFTYYFYWYDVPSRSHLDSLTNVPIDYATMSWQDVNWHKKQLEGIIYSGIDVILPIFWYDQWSKEWSHPGLEKLAEALERTRLEGKTPPAVGMFVDTTSSTGADLRLQAKQEDVYENIHFFFSTISRNYWALAENERPIVWFYISYFPSAYDQTFIDYIYENFNKDFGVRPYLVFEQSWDFPTETIDGQQVKDTNAGHLKYDASYTWGGALAPNSSAQIASIGPGYDDHTVPDRVPPSFADRQNGDTYRNNFAYAIACGTPWLAIETWNEYHEATQIAETIEYGRQYLDITHEYIKYFKEGKLPEGLGGIYANANSVDILLGAKDQDMGLSLGSNVGDGQYTPVDIHGVSAKQTVPMAPNAEASYLYFLVDNSFYFNTPNKIKITVTYFDNGNEPIHLQYDTSKCASPIDIPKIYKEILIGKRHNTQTWKTVSIQISDATFAGNQNFGTDFRLATYYSPLTVSEIRVEKIP